MLWPDNPDLDRTEAQAFIAGASTNIPQVALVEASNGDLIGFIELNIRTYAPGSVEREVPFVEGWFVADAYRGQAV